MNFFLIMGTLCIFLHVNATRLGNCTGFEKEEGYENLIFTYGLVCTKISCDWSVDSNCKNGTYSEVLKWETDIFEIGFEEIKNRRPREIFVRIDLNDDYYIEIKVISDKEKRTVKVILNECSHKGKQCLEIRNFTRDNLDIKEDNTFVAIGFRKDKKINFATESNGLNHATNLFGPDNEYEFKTPGFYFNTSETKKITVSSKYDENYEYNGLTMLLPTSVGGMLFNEKGYLVHDDFKCDGYYEPADEKKGLLYILREYFNNSENWKANVVSWTPDTTVPYFDENGMKFKPEQMKIKEEENPNFDAKKMIRKGCKYVEKKEPDPEPDITETTTLTEDDVTETAKAKNSVSTPMPQAAENKFYPMGSLPEHESKIALEEITINKVILIPKTDPSEDNINIYDLIDRAGNKSFDPNFFKNIGKGGNDLKNVKLYNGTPVDVSGYKFKDPNGKKKKKETKQSGGSGGAGDASRGQKEVKNICPKYIVILILMILSV